MHSKLSMCLSMVVLLAGCNISDHLYTRYHLLTNAGKEVKFIETKLDSRCLFLGKIEGQQTNWMSPADYDKSRSMESAAIDLRNKAAEMGGNVIEDLKDATFPFLDQDLPVDTKISGNVYKCP